MELKDKQRPRISIPANEEAISAMNSDRTLSRDLCFIHPDSGLDETAAGERFRKFAETYIEARESCNTDLLAIIKSKLSKSGGFGDKTSMDPTPRLVDTEATVRNVLEFCRGSELDLSVFCLTNGMGGRIQMYQAKKKSSFAPDFEFISDEDQMPLEQPYVLVIFSETRPVLIVCAVNPDWLSYWVETKEELDIMRKVFSHPASGERSCIAFREEDTKAQVQYVLRSSNGYTTKYMDVNYVDCDVGENYNDDLSMERIDGFLASDEPGLMIFHGEPGTGKTTFIRKLVWDNSETNKFIIMDKTIFSDLSDSSLMAFLLNNVGSTIIFEDCEELLKSREGGNSAIASLLNLSDGILGDMLHLKFICTFNADLVEVDKALLRKGRLKYIYDFKPLCHEKAVKLADKLGKDSSKLPGKDVPLCDIYNLLEDVGTKKKQARSIGF